MPGHSAMAEQGAGQQYASYAGNRVVTARTPANGGTAIPAEAVFIEVTSAAATNVIILPAPSVGRIIRGYVGANGCEIWASGTSVTINDVVASVTNEAAIPATTLFRLECVSSTQWILTALDEVGAVITAIIPDARP